MEKINGKVRVSRYREKGSRSPQYPQGSSCLPWGGSNSEEQMRSREKYMLTSTLHGLMDGG